MRLAFTANTAGASEAYNTTGKVKCMIVRNSIKSIIRTPIRTALFALLIAATTAFLYLGVNTWAASTAMLRDWNENCTTIVTMEYLEDYGSNVGSKSEAMLADIAGIDFDAIAANKNVLLWQPSDVSTGTIPGFVSNKQSADSYNCVLIVTGVREYAQGEYCGVLVESLYSFRTYEPGRILYIENWSAFSESEPDPEAIYVIHAENTRLNANGLSVRIKPFYSWIAQQAGVDCDTIEPVYEIESAEALHADESNIYDTIAKYYSAKNNSVTVYRVRDLAALEEFNQSYLQLVSGRLFTRQEGEEGAKVCVISQTLADSKNLKVGDSLTINLPDDENASTYEWGDKISRSETLTIIGIVNYHVDYYLNVYTPTGSGQARPVRYLYDLGQAIIKNGTVDTFLSQIRPLLPERVFITVYDQGYQTTADALRVVQNAAIALSIIALAVTLTVLAFFSHLFSDMQREAVEIMRCFGTKKGEVRLYLMVGTSLIAFVAIATGILIGTGYAERLIESAYRFVSELQAMDMRYSDGFRGIAKEFTPVVKLSVLLAGAVGAGVFLASLVLCLYFAEKIVSGRLISARARVRKRRPPRRSSVALSGALRHAVLSIRRSGVRSIIVPVLCAAALLFVASLQATLDSYDEAREELYDNTVLRGYCAQMNGKFSDRLYIPNNLAKMLVELEHISDPAFTYTINYIYLGIPLRADGSEGQVEPPPIPKDSYELEILVGTLRAQPNIIFTDSARQAPEFYFSGFQADFMPGWDEARFSSREWEQLPCIVSSQFMSKHGIVPGDTIRVFVDDFSTIDMLVVGSFVRVASQDNIYCPLPAGALNPDWKSDDYSIQQQVISNKLFYKYVTALTFEIPDPRNLGEVKDALEQAGFSGPKLANDIRLCVVIEDAQFNETLSSIAQRSKYLEILYPVLIALVCILGLITGFLAANSRREDIAIMRSLGTQKRRIFATILYEQVLLLFIGTIPAVAIWYAREGTAQLVTPGVYAFLVCYVLSAGFSTLLHNARSALSILWENE